MTNNPKTQPTSDATICTIGGAHEKGAVATPIFQTSTFRFESVAQVAEYARGEGPRYQYTRYANPTLEDAEVCLAALERGARAFVFASGQAATSAWCYAHLRPGDRLVASNRLYGGTVQFFNRGLAPFGVEIQQVDLTQIDALDAHLQGAKACWFETPTNPTLRVLDGRAIAAACRKHGVLSAVDNTFASPINQKPLEWGIDWVMHSVTKYLNGHNDLIGGALIARDGIDTGLVDTVRRGTGGVMDPHAAFMLRRGLRTLVVRVERHNSNALALAQHLSQHPKIERVYYPGLKSHPDHAIAKAQMKGFGGMVACDVRGGFEDTARFVDHLRVITNAASLGGTESLLSMPVLTSHVKATPEERAAAGVTDHTVRISVGLEASDELIADLDNALKAV